MADLRGGIDHAVRGTPADFGHLDFEERGRGEIRMNTKSLRFGIVAVLMLATALVLQAHSRIEFFPPRASLSSLPQQIDGWTGTDSVLDQETLDILGPGEFLIRDYENASQSQPQSQPWINLYIAYFPTQKTADSIRMNRSDGGLVRLMTPMLEGESRDAAQARLMTLGSQFLPLLDSYIPQ